MRITVDTSRCCGSGNCVMTVPEVFDQETDDGTVRLVQPEPGEALWPRVAEAAYMCPAAAIDVEE